MQLRHVSRVTEGECVAAPLTKPGAGKACGISGSWTYDLGPAAGELIVQKASIATEFEGVSTGQPMVVVEVDRPSAKTFAAVTKASVGKPLAFLIEGRVVNAPVITSPITDGSVALIPDPYTDNAEKALETALEAS